MRMIVGKARGDKKTLEQVRAGESIKFDSFSTLDKTLYELKAVGEVVDVNPGNLMELQNAEVVSGSGITEICYARYMPGEGTVIVRIE